MPTPSPTAPTRVLVVGGGVAGLETVLALRALDAERVSIELLAPERTFAYRPLAVAEPFGGPPVQRFPLAAIAEDLGVRFHRDALARVRHDDRVVETLDGARLLYDGLVLALGARPVEAVPGALTFRGPQDAGRAAALVDALRRGEIRRAAFVVPAGTNWAIPLYELALQAAAALAGTTARAALTVVTPEPRPLAAFGEQASDAVAAMLAERGVALRTGTVARILADGRLELGPDGSIAADAAVALPRLVGPRPRGVPVDALGFVPVDPYTRVPTMDGVHAVGDVAAHGVKQGGLAAQQADVAAAVLAARAGAPVAPEPYRPVLRGLLLTGRGATYVRHDPAGTSQVSEEMLWWPPGKIAGRHLGPYLAGHRDLGVRPDAGAPSPRDVAA